MPDPTIAAVTINRLSPFRVVGRSIVSPDGSGFPRRRSQPSRHRAPQATRCRVGHFGHPLPPLYSTAPQVTAIATAEVTTAASSANRPSLT
jgi:hypothetical protein